MSARERSQLLRTRSERAVARAFTLAELTVALAISSILVVGAGVVLTSTMSSVDRGAGTAAVQSGISRAIATINADAAVAISIDTSTPYQLAMSVPDRTGDSIAEFVRYTWSGSKGDPLIRSVNGSTQTILNDVRDWSFASIRRPGPLISTVSGATVFDHLPSGTVKNQGVDNAKFTCISLKPDFPANVSSWEITRIDLMLARGGGGRSLLLDLCRSNPDGTPTPSVITSVAQSGDALSGSAPSWFTIDVALPNLMPGTPISIVLRGDQGGTCVNIGKVDGVQQPGACSIWSTSNGGTKWSAESFSIPIRIQGSYTTRTEQ